MFQNEFYDEIHAEISVVLNGKGVLLFGYCVVTRQSMNSEGSIVQRNLNTVRLLPKRKNAKIYLEMIYSMP